MSKSSFVSLDKSVISRMRFNRGARWSA